MEQLLVVAEAHAAALSATVEACLAKLQADPLPSRLSFIEQVTLTIENASLSEDPVYALGDRIARINTEQFAASFKSDDWHWLFLKPDEERQEQSFRLINAARDFWETRPNDLDALSSLASLLLRFSLIDSGALDIIIAQFLLTTALDLAPSAVLCAFHEALPILISSVTDDLVLGRFAAVASRFVTHHAYCMEACAVLARHLNQIIVFWTASILHKGTLMQILSALNVNPALLNVFIQNHLVSSSGSKVSYATTLLDSVIDSSTGLIKGIGACDEIALRDLQESLRLIGLIASQSADIAAQYASTLFDHDLFVGDLIRSLRLDLNSVSGPGAESIRRISHACRQLEALAGVIVGLNVASKSLQKSRSRIERQVIDSASNHWDFFVGPFSKIMVALDKYRNDYERSLVAWTGRLSLVEIVKRIPRLITRMQFDDGSLITYTDYGACMDMVSIIQLLKLFSKSKPDPSHLTPENYQRVCRVATKRLSEIISAIPYQLVRASALQALIELGFFEDQGSLISETLSSFDTTIKHHKMKTALDMVYIVFQMIYSSKGPLKVNYDDVVKALLSFIDLSDHSSTLSDPILEDKFNQNLLLASCVKVLMLAWRNIPFANAIATIPVARVRSILARTLALEFLPLLEQLTDSSPNEQNKDDWIPVGDDPNYPINYCVMIEQTLLGFNCNTVLGVIDELSEIVKNIVTPSKIEEEPISSSKLKARLDVLTLRCVLQVADVISGDRKEDVLLRLASARSFDEWLSLPSGRPLTACVERETMQLSTFDRRRYYLTKPSNSQVAGITNFLKSVPFTGTPTKWKESISSEGKSKDSSFIMLEKSTNAICGFCFLTGQKIDCLAIGSTLSSQDQYDIRLCLLSYCDRWAGLNGHDTLQITLPHGSSDAAFMTRHDHVFRIHQIEDIAVTFYWNTSLEYPLEERIDHDLSTVQGQIKSLITKRIQSDNPEEPLLSPLSRIYNIISCFIPFPTKSQDCDTFANSFRSLVESHSRQMYERVMRTHASKDVLQASQDAIPEIAPLSDFLSSLQTEFVKESWLTLVYDPLEGRDAWTPPAIGSFEENLIGFTTQSVQNRLFCDIRESRADSAPARSTSIISPTALVKSGSANFESLPLQIQLIDNENMIDPVTVILAAFARILHTCLSNGTEFSKRKSQKYILRKSILGSLQHWIVVTEFSSVQGPIDLRLLLGKSAIKRFGIGAKLLQTLSKALNWSAWGLEAFVESCEQLYELLSTAFLICSRLATAIQSRRDSVRRLPSCMESMMLYAAQLIKDILTTLPLLHYLDRLTDPANPDSIAIDDTPPDVLHRFNLQLQLYVTNLLFGDNRALKYMQHFVNYDQELSAQTFASKSSEGDFFEDYQEGFGTTVDQMRINIVTIMGTLMHACSEIRHCVLHQYSMTATKYDISVRPSFLQSILLQTSAQSLSESLQQSFLNRRLFAFDESIEYTAPIEVRAKTFLGSSAIRTKLLVMSCHYVYISIFDVSPGAVLTGGFRVNVSDFYRIHYSAVYDVRIDVTGQVLSVGHSVSPTSEFSLQYEFWICRTFGSVHEIANLFERKCRLFTTLYWVPIRLSMICLDQDPLSSPVAGFKSEPNQSTKLPIMKIATLVDVLKPSGLLERKLLMWAETRQNHKPKQVLYVGDDNLYLAELAKYVAQKEVNLLDQKLPFFSWMNHSSTECIILSQLQRVDVTETTKSILTLNFINNRTVSIFFVCDASRETWKRALRKYLLMNSSKKEPWDMLMIPPRQVL